MKFKDIQLAQGVITIGVLLLMPHLALAAAPWETPMSTLVNYITGSTGQLLATLAVAIVGVLCLTGRIAWGIAASVLFGIAVVFGSAQIVTMFHP